MDLELLKETLLLHLRSDGKPERKTLVPSPVPSQPLQFPVEDADDHTMVGVMELQLVQSDLPEFPPCLFPTKDVVQLA